MSTVTTISIRRPIVEVTLETFSKECILKHMNVSEASLIENDPDEEDSTWDFATQQGTVYTTATVIAPDGEETHYIGLTRDWEGLKNSHD